MVGPVVSQVVTLGRRVQGSYTVLLARSTERERYFSKVKMFPVSKAESSMESESKQM